MKKTLHIAICLAAGFAGGMISRSFAPAVVLTDQTGRPLAKLVAGAGLLPATKDPMAQLAPKLRLIDMNGIELWNAGGGINTGIATIAEVS